MTYTITHNDTALTVTTVDAADQMEVENVAGMIYLYEETVMVAALPIGSILSIVITPEA